VREISRIQAGTERPRTTASEAGKGKREDSLAWEAARYSIGLEY